MARLNELKTLADKEKYRNLQKKDEELLNLVAKEQ